jgi:peptide/nickel transport system substrate-binding protein
MSRARDVVAMTAVVALVGLASGACRQSGGNPANGIRPTLRIGVGGFASTGNEGLRSLAQVQAVESLARLSDDGRPQPWLAHDWNLSPDGLSLTMNLVSGVKFHDGSALTADIVANALKVTLPNTMGPAFSDVESIAATSDQQIVIRLHQPSPLLLDALEVPVPKPGTNLVGTGAFMVDNPQSPTEMRANDSYYLGRPSIARISVTNYPSVRAAWAEMLRGQLDMLYEVGVDALDSLEASNNISTFTFVRRYQMAMVLNNQSDVFRSKATRRAVNFAVDRDAVVRQGMNGHGVVSTGPVWPHHYAFRPGLPQFGFDLKQASQLLAQRTPASKTVRFTCLVRPDAVAERVALVLKRQLQQIGVQMSIEELPVDRQIAALRSGQFEAVLTEMVSGPTLLRPYQLWHSGGFLNFKSASIDAALDEVRHSASDDAYLRAVAGLQQAMLDDPPAIFLAWMERARAVSKRFDVPPVEAGRDILAGLRQWKSSGLVPQASRN